MSVTLESLNDVLLYIASGLPPHILVANLRNFVKRDVGETILASTSPDGIDPLSVINPEAHTIGALFILSARLATTEPNVPFEYIDAFCSSFDPIVAREAPERVTLLARGIAHIAEVNDNHRLSLGPLQTLLERYRPSPGHLTTIHCIFLRMCVRSECWTQALPLLATPLTDVDRSLSDVSYHDNLIYYYLGGIIYAVLKKWEQAEDFFEMAVSVPGFTVSAIQLEALKKLTLVQLILHGKTRSLPKYASSALPRLLRQSPYQNLIRNYPGSLMGLSVTLEKEAVTFKADGNVGLVKQVIRHAPRWIVRKLTNTYTTLSLEEISKATGTDVKQASTAPAIEAATLLILGMIERGEIYATITPSHTNNPAAATVTFRDPPPPTYFDASVLQRILSQAQAQGIQLALDDKVLGRNKTYLQKAVKDREYGVSAQYDDMDNLGDMATVGDWD